MAEKGGLSSTMHNTFKETLSERPVGNNVMDHNSCAPFSKPHDVGPDGIPLVFETTVKGRGDRGSPGKDAAVSSTMSAAYAKGKGEELA
jgi:hypothetical protein